MTMTLDDRAKLAVHELQAWPQRLDAQKAYLLRMLCLAVVDEREQCAQIADGAADCEQVADEIRACRGLRGKCLAHSQAQPQCG